MPGDRTTSVAPLQSLKLTDFTAGIISAAQLQAFATSPAGPNRAVPNQAQRPSFTPNTYGVYGLPNGGILLGPTQYGFTTPSLTIPGSVNSLVVTGVIRDYGWNADNDYNYLFVAEGENPSTGNFYTMLYAAESGGAAIFSADTGLSATNPTNSYYSMSYPFITTLTDGTNFIKTICWTVTTRSGSVLYYATGSGGAAFTRANTDASILIPANGRVWQLSDQLINVPLTAINYNDPTIPANGDNHSINAAGTVIDYDNAAPFGAWGVISSANTLLVKTVDGAIIVTGDIFNPTISRAPSVKGTNGLVGVAALTPIGLVYRSQEHGIWVWDGSTSSSKLSQNISDTDFSLVEYFDGFAFYAPGFDNNFQQPDATFNVQYINNMVFDDTGHFYDPATGAWWRLPPWVLSSDGYSSSSNILVPRFLMETGFALGNAFKAPCFFSDVYNEIYYSWDVSRPSVGGSYTIVPPSGQFASYIELNPIQIQTDDILQIEEVSVVMQGFGTLFVSCRQVSGLPANPGSGLVSQATTFERFTIITNLQTDVVVLQIGWVNDPTGDNPCTPIIESIEIKYREIFPVLSQANSI